MFSLIPHGTNIDFVGKRHIWATLSIIAFVGSVVLLATKGLNYGIDFTGGAELHVKIPSQWDTAQLREQLEKGGLPDVRLVHVGDPSANEYLIRVQGEAENLNEISKNVEKVLSDAFSKDQYEIFRSDIVGPAAGKLLRRNGLLAAIYALIAILIYIWFQFDARYAPGAVIALFHDSVIVLGIFVLTQKQFDLTILAAILALIGYSNNDTVIIYDRVRETSHLHPNWSIEQKVNVAMNETLARSIVTSLTTFLVAMSIWFFGGPVLENFAFTYVVGLVLGSYSTIFIASSLIITITHMRNKREDHGGSSQKKKLKKVYDVRPEPKLGA